MCNAPSKARSLEDEVKQLHAQLAEVQQATQDLHDCLEAKGINSRRVGDALHGRVFAQPVDKEHKARTLDIFSCAVPHARAFHASWFAFFSTFFSTFAAAPLGAILKSKTTLGLTRSDIGNGNISSVASNIAGRLVMGFICDKLGARRGLAFLMFMTCPPIIAIAFTTNAVGFIACRFFIGFGLASFVACQVWCTQQFSPSVVGVANATAGGWGNLGGGVTNLLMPVIFVVFMSATNNNENVAWRLCFIVPLLLHIASGLFALTGRDLPDGNYAELELSGAKQKTKGNVVVKVGASNINAWILTISYGFCFGVELTMSNVAALYFHEYHGMTLVLSGVFASIFGLVNIFARSLGGITSDWANKHFGMRGRIWAYWLWQTIEGVLCVLMGQITWKMRAPTFKGDEAKITGWSKVEDTWHPFNTTSTAAMSITACGARQVTLTTAMKDELPAAFSKMGVVVLTEPPAPWGAGDGCVSNSGTLATVVFIMFLFSIAVQMAEGLTFGIVPSVSRPALGIVSGMVGAGGNLGAVITSSIFFKGSFRSDEGIVWMGVTIIVVTASLFFVYFPDMGGMFVPAGALGSYDPQLIKPPAGYRGADSMDFSQANTGTSNAGLVVVPDPEKVPKTETVSQA
jgi:NNP family nitrate/nitrite transporter-like MFS transporter